MNEQPPDWKQDQAETSRLAPARSSAGSTSEPNETTSMEEIAKKQGFSLWQERAPQGPWFLETPHDGHVFFGGDVVSAQQCRDAISRLCARITDAAQSVQVPMAYWVEHPTFGMELSLDPPNESAVQRGWVATPLYASQPSPAATVERVQTFAEAAAKIRATRIETTYNLATGERDNEETDPAYFRSSAGSDRLSDHKTRLLDDFGRGYQEGVKFERERQITLSLDRDWLGRMVRHAWVEWAKMQDAPKAHWLLPYDELSEPDKEADRQIGEYLIEWAKKYAPAALIAVEPQAVPTLIELAIEREEKYLHDLIDDEAVGSVMHGDIEGAFHRLNEALALSRPEHS